MVSLWPPSARHRQYGLSVTDHKLLALLVMAYVAIEYLASVMQSCSSCRVRTLLAQWFFDLGQEGSKVMRYTFSSSQETVAGKSMMMNLINVK
jgi:hypothetical protein